MRVPGGPSPIRRQKGLTLKQAIRRRLAKQQLHDALEAGYEAIATEMVDIAVQLSSGTVDSAKAGHPYSRAKPNPTFDPRLINVGFGKHKGKRFADSWETLPPSMGIGIRNTSAVGPYLEHGTRRMIARPISELIVQQAAKIAPKHLQQALLKSQYDLVTLTRMTRPTTILRPAAS